MQRTNLLDKTKYSYGKREEPDAPKHPKNSCWIPAIALERILTFSSEKKKKKIVRVWRPSNNFLVPFKQDADDLLRSTTWNFVFSREFKQEELSTLEIKEEITFHIKMKQNLKVTLPNTIPIGPFIVNVRPLKDFLMQKRRECATGLLVMFTEKLRTEVDDILEEYRQMRYRLREVPQSIEHIFEIRDWMETIPLRVQNLEEKMDKLKLDFDVLDSFLWNISDDDFQAKWEVIGSPLQIENQVKVFVLTD